MLAGALLAICAASSFAQDKFIVVASTTSTEQSGLFGYLLPLFEKDSAIKVRVVALGTGQALDLARRGDADVVFVHDQEAEEKFLAEVSASSAFRSCTTIWCWWGRRAIPPG
jgi:tungstate transport system substrate-binding protein